MRFHPPHCVQLHVAQVAQRGVGLDGHTGKWEEINMRNYPIPSKATAEQWFKTAGDNSMAQARFVILGLARNHGEQGTAPVVSNASGPTITDGNTCMVTVIGTDEEDVTDASCESTQVYVPGAQLSGNTVAPKFF